MVRIIIHPKQNGTKYFDDIRTVLFDLDGTLIDTLDLHIESFKWILNKLGLENKVTDEELGDLMGKTPHDIIRKYFEDIPKEKLWEAAKAKENYLASIVKNVYVYPYVKDFLAKLKENGVYTVVISSTYFDLVKLLLENAELMNKIDFIVSGDQIENGKPLPEPFLKGLEKTGSNHHQAIAIGDSVYDCKSATAAEIIFTGILTGKTKAEKFEENGCTFVIEDLNRIEVIAN